MIFDYINDKTGFANGDLFENEREVREYFTMENMEIMFGDDIEIDDLDIMADIVISNKWHMKKEKTKVFSIRFNINDSEGEINQKISELQTKVRSFTT